ncbi:hypothetical protein ABFU82_22700 [Nocardioides sp. WV_118_6]
MSTTVDTSPLPFAPLTFEALNVRTADLLGVIAWGVAAEVALGREIDTRRLRRLAERLNAENNAAVIRAGHQQLRRPR